MSLFGAEVEEIVATLGSYTGSIRLYSFVVLMGAAEYHCGFSGCIAIKHKKCCARRQGLGDSVTEFLVALCHHSFVCKLGDSLDEGLSEHLLERFKSKHD